MTCALLNSRETFDDLHSHAREINERWQKRAAIYAKRRLIEHYVSGELYVGIRCVSGEFEQYGFVFQGSGLEERNLATNDKRNARIDDGGDQPFMFSKNVEFMERPQKIVPSIVWAVRFDDSNFTRRKPLYAFEPVFGVDEIVTASKDREMRITARRYAVVSSQRCGEEIKRTSRLGNGSFARAIKIFLSDLGFVSVTTMSMPSSQDLVRAERIGSWDSPQSTAALGLVDHRAW